MKGAATFMKSDRMLWTYSRLINGETLNKKELAQHFHVTERSIQRDLEALRSFLAEQCLPHTIVYDKKDRGYRMERGGQSVPSSGEILAVCKILLASRSLCQAEMLSLTDKLIACCAPREQEAAASMIACERHNYRSPQDHGPVLDGLWEIGQAVEGYLVMEIAYRQPDGEIVCCSLEPVGLLFSECHFCLVGFPQEEPLGKGVETPDAPLPAVFRLDRIQRFTVTEKPIASPAAARFRAEAFEKGLDILMKNLEDYVN